MKRGDINGDGNIDILDFILLIKHLQGIKIIDDEDMRHYAAIYVTICYPISYNMLQHMLLHIATYATYMSKHTRAE